YPLDTLAGLEALLPGRNRHGSGERPVDVALHPQRLRVHHTPYRPADGERNIPLLVAVDAVARIDALEPHMKSDLRAGRPVLLGPITHRFAVDPVPCTDNRRVGLHDEVALDRGAVLHRRTEMHLDREADADRLAAERHDSRVQLTLGLDRREGCPAGRRRAVGVGRGGRYGIARVEVEDTA